MKKHASVRKLKSHGNEKNQEIISHNAQSIEYENLKRGTLDSAGVIRLQQTIGNRAVQSLLSDHHLQHHTSTHGPQRRIQRDIEYQQNERYEDSERLESFLPTRPNQTPDPRAKSTVWTISAGISAGASWGIFGGQVLYMNLKNRTTDESKALVFYSLGFTKGLKGGATISMPGETQFTTDEPLAFEDFNTFGEFTVTEFAPIIGGALAYVTFFGLSTSPSVLDVGGVEVGVAGGIGSFTGRFKVLGLPDNESE